jgi:transposase
MSKVVAREAKVSPSQQEILESIVRRSSGEQRLVGRAQIILGCAGGKGNKPLARELSVVRDTVKCWRGRWADAKERMGEAEAKGSRADLEAAILETLDDAPRSGSPGKFSAEQFCSIMAIACEPPEDSERPMTHWTAWELADEAQKRHVVTSISVRHVGRFLKRGRP